MVSGGGGVLGGTTCLLDPCSSRVGPIQLAQVFTNLYLGDTHHREWGITRAAHWWYRDTCTPSNENSARLQLIVSR